MITLFAEVVTTSAISNMELTALFAWFMHTRAVPEVARTSSHKQTAADERVYFGEAAWIFFVIFHRIDHDRHLDVIWSPRLMCQMERGLQLLWSRQLRFAAVTCCNVLSGCCSNV